MSGSVDRFSFLSGANAAYIEGLYEEYKENPEGVDSSWRRFFEGYDFAMSMPSLPATDSLSEDSKAAKVEWYINLIRRIGYLSAYLDPLGQKPELKAELRPERQGLQHIDDEKLFQPATFLAGKSQTWRDIKENLYKTYCGNIGVDFRDIPSVEEVQWFQQEMESCRNQPSFSKDDKVRIIDFLSKSEGFEKFLGDRFLGQKRFSLEGLESLIPFLHVMADNSARGGVEEICLGMAHRGRLNVLANFMGKPYELMLKEFEGSDFNTHDIDGDVKYHMGYGNYIETISGKKVRAFLLPNPSHLEAVNPVVEGFTRARQRLCQDKDRSQILPVLMHGDASFIGQGIVAESLNLSELSDYRTGGTIHIILNNQVGFTTDPEDSRSCNYPSDIAKLVRAPIIHVNADCPESVAWAAELVSRYRQKFHRDVVVDLVGYRRHGHNETDEPSFTQPNLYKTIKAHKTCLMIYGEALVEQGVLSESEVSEKKRSHRSHLQECLDRVRAKNYEALNTIPSDLDFSAKKKVDESDFFKKVNTKLSTKVIKEIGVEITGLPDGFTPHPKIKKLFAARKKMLAGKGAVDWGLAELLAFSSVAKDGFHVRLSGQDSKRGTFSHRHAVVTDIETGEQHCVLSQQDGGRAEVTVINSPLSEQGVLGFEFGYSVAHQNSLVMWEAQFGDFSNGAQIIIDQFLAASEAKWKQVSGLVLLLPHGYEGMGPEHSSARPERYLQLCGSNNMQVANVTTPAQMFHILRRQALRNFRNPLVILTPKSLLRHPRVVSTFDDFSKGGFRPVIDDDRVVDKEAITRVVFCTGKIFYELLESREQNGILGVAIVRVEQLYPFPEDMVAQILDGYKGVREVIWTQEEPSNMGYWTFVRHRIKRLAMRTATFRYSGRKGAGTTAEGSGKSHAKEQLRIIQDSLGLACPINPELEGIQKK